MIKKEIEIYAPLMNAEEFEDKFGSVKKALDELVELSGKIDVRFNNEKIVPLRIKRISKRHHEIREIFKDDFAKSVIQMFLKFSCKIEIKTKEEFELKKEHYISLEYFTEHYVQHLIIYLNLAKPGVFDTRDGLLRLTEVVDKQKVEIKKFPMLANSIGYAVELADKYNWPPIQSLPINKTLDWLNKHWQAFESISENKLQRALNAFSYLFTENISSSDFSTGDLFHSLIGIEAIYVIGNTNIQEQVNQKSQLLLGIRRDYKKILTQLYDYRSRYIHGQLNFINKYFTDDKQDKAIDQMLNTYEKSVFAIAILVASIQKHIEYDKEEFEFELILKK
jgi:hypothetical protein